MKYWLIKSEPATWSWADQVTAITTHWNGVRNYQAANNLRAMALHDQALFYHSGDERAIQGIVEIVKTAYPDPSDAAGKFVMVDVKVVKAFKKPVSLALIKEKPALQHLALIRQSRLSVMPIDAASWRILWDLGGL